MRCERDVGGARDVYEVPLPAVLTVLEGLNLPRYPSVPGRLRAKSKPLAVVEPARPESKLEKLRLVVPGGPGQAGRDPRHGRRRGAEGRRGHAAARCRVSDVPALRVSDADRERTVLVLREHAAVGRLTLEEFTERMTAAYRAVTRNELDELARDLPEVPATASASRRRPTRWVISRCSARRSATAAFARAGASSA